MADHVILYLIYSFNLLFNIILTVLLPGCTGLAGGWLAGDWLAVAGWLAAGLAGCLLLGAPPPPRSLPALLAAGWLPALLAAGWLAGCLATSAWLAPWCTTPARWAG